MKRVFFAFAPLDTNRPGGAWWLRDLPDHEVDAFVKDIAPYATGLRVSSEFPMYDLNNIQPPADAEVIK